MILDEFKEIVDLVGTGRFGHPVSSLHAPEVECMGKGEPQRSYEFGAVVMIATTLHRSKGGQFMACESAGGAPLRVAAQPAVRA